MKNITQTRFTKIKKNYINFFNISNTEYNLKKINN